MGRHLPMLFRSPAGYNLLVPGPANYPKDGVRPLEGIVEPWSLGYELASRRFLESRASQTYRSRAIARPICAAAYHAISSVAPRFVHKSVHNTTERRV
jgi:hypothetical protein